MAYNNHNISRVGSFLFLTRIYIQQKTSFDTQSDSKFTIRHLNLRNLGLFELLWLLGLGGLGRGVIKTQNFSADQRIMISIIKRGC